MIDDAFVIPAGFIPALLSNATQIVADVFPIIALILGILIGGWVVTIVIGWFLDINERRDRITPEGVQAQEDAGLFDFDDE